MICVLVANSSERLTPVCIKSHNTQCMSDQKTSPEVQRTLPKALWSICGQTYCIQPYCIRVLGKTLSISISLFSQEHSGSIIVKWKKSTRTLSRAGHPAILSNQARMALVRELTRNPRVTELPLLRWKNLLEDQSPQKYSINQVL